jgi:hypothetical protein
MSVIYSCCWSSPGWSFLGPSPAGFMTVFHCLRFKTPPTWRARSPIFISPTNMVAWLYPQALGSLFIACDSQGYGGGIWPCRHTGFTWYHLHMGCWSSFYRLCMDHIENTAFSVVACVFIATGMCLPSCWLVTAISSSSAILTFRHHTTICLYQIILRLLLQFSWFRISVLTQNLFWHGSFRLLVASWMEK